MRDPNYVPTLEDRAVDALGAAVLGGGIALLAYSAFQVLRWMKTSE